MILYDRIPFGNFPQIISFQRVFLLRKVRNPNAGACRRLYNCLPAICQTTDNFIRAGHFYGFYFKIRLAI